MADRGSEVVSTAENIVAVDQRRSSYGVEEGEAVSRDRRQKYEMGKALDGHQAESHVQEATSRHVSAST